MCIDCILLNLQGFSVIITAREDEPALVQHGFINSWVSVQALVNDDDCTLVNHLSQRLKPFGGGCLLCLKV